MAELIITTNGAPVTRFPTFLYRKDNQYFLRLHRVEIHEVNGRLKAEPIYLPGLVVIRVGGEIDLITPTHVLIFTKWRPFFNAFRHDRF